MRMQWIALSALHDDVETKKEMCNLCVEYPAACTALTPTENESICCSRYRRTHTHTLESDRIYSTHLPHSYCEFLLSVCFLFEFPCRCRLIILFNLKYKYYSCDANDNIVGCCAICLVSCSGYSTQHDCIASNASNFHTANYFLSESLIPECFTFEFLATYYMEKRQTSANFFYSICRLGGRKRTLATSKLIIISCSFSIPFFDEVCEQIMI